MAKRANIFDPIQKELDQKVFNGINPRPRVVKFVEDEMRKVLAPLLGFDPTEFMDIYLTGSLTTYQYDETSDFDISVFIQWDLWPTGEDPNMIRRKIIPFVMDKLDGSLVPGTRHPIQHFVVPPGARVEDMYKPGLRSAWSFRDHKWLVPPEKDRVHDVSVELPVLYHRAEMMADKMEELLAYNPIYAKEFWHQIHRKRQMDQKAGKGDFSEGNIVYKYLLHNGYFDRIRDELGERISKVAVGLPGESYWPEVGQIWTVADPWAKTRTPSGPDRYTVEIIDVDDDDIWVRDVDSKAERSWPLYTWQRWMDTGRVWKSNQNWQLNESPEEATDLWPDTLPDNWSMVREAATQRLFLAYELPENIVAQVMQWQDANLPEGVHPEPDTNLHMTIAFLGDTDTSLIPAFQQILGEIDPSQVILSGPIEYRELDKLAFLALQDNGGNEVVEQINEKLNQLMGYEPQFKPWLPHITVWRYGPDTKPNLQPQLPNFGSFTPVGVHVYTSVKNPAGGGTYQKVASPTPEDYARGLYSYAVQTLTPQELFSWMARTLAADLKMSLEDSRVLTEHVIGQGGDWHGVWQSKTAGIPSESELMPYVCNEGECHEYANWVADSFPDLEFVSGAFKMGERDYADHSWTVAPDGTIVDTTFSQFGGDDRPINIVSPGQPEYELYRPVEEMTEEERHLTYGDDQGHKPGEPGYSGPYTSKTADDLGWVERKYPGDTGAINAPDHSSEDPISDQPTSVPPRDVPAMDNLPNEKSFKVIYDYEKDQIILGDIRVSDKYPPGQIIGEYKHDDVVLNDNVDAWLNPKYFKRLWQHSFPKRPLKSIILDKGDGQHEVVHRSDTLRS